MKIRFSSSVSVLWCFLLVSTRSAGGAELSLAQAKTATGKWLSTQRQPLGAQIGSTPVAGTTYSDVDGTALFHVVKLAEGGFVVTSADDGVTPIIAFSEGDDFDANDENPLWVLLNADMKNRRIFFEEKRAVLNVVMSVAAANLTEPDGPEAQWAALLSDSSFSIPGLSSSPELRVSPLVQSKWSQSTVGSLFNKVKVYNYYTPNNYVCGCVATAAAQVMRYHQFPTASMPTFTKTCKVSGISTSLTSKGGIYAWSAMSLIPTTSITDTQCQAIGKLAYDAGVSVAMQYSFSSSGAYTSDLADSFVENFGYSNAMTYSLFFYSETLVQRGVLCNLDAGYPVVLGVGGDSGGHAIVADGYGYSSSTRYVHLNMGWGGTSDAWYNLPDIDAYFTFDSLNTLVYNVFTNKTGELLTGRIVDLSGNPLSGAMVTVKSGSTVVGTGMTGETGVYGIHVGTIASSSTTMTVIADYFGNSATNTATVKRSSSALFGSSVGNSWGNDFILTRALSETTTTPVAVAYSWLDGYGLVANSDYEAAAFSDTDLDGFQAWQEYVAGTNPTNATSRFISSIALIDGQVVVDWTPDLGSARAYTVYGKTSLLDTTWLTPTNAATRFFKVKVEMNVP